jgi:hypothetical protein
MHGRTIQTILNIRAVTSRFCIHTRYNQRAMPSERQSCRSLEALNQQSKTRKKIGRPKLPKGEAKGRIVPIRFNAQDLKRIESAAKGSQQTVSEWIRDTIATAMGAQ